MEDMEVYAGKQPLGLYQVTNDVESVVKYLIPPIHNSVQNVTTDNYSVPLPNNLYINHRFTLHKNKWKIPPHLETKVTPIYSFVFAYSIDNSHSTMASYFLTNNKNSSNQLFITMTVSILNLLN